MLHRNAVKVFEGQEADQGMGADLIRQAVVDRGDLDVGLQDAEAALDVGKRLQALPLAVPSEGRRRPARP